METSRIVTVTQDGSGDYCSVQEAVDSVPLGNTCRTVICIPPGIYKQPVYVPKRKNFITFAGIFPETTVMTWNNTATKNEHHQEASVIGKGTFASGTVIVEGDDFIAENITFENSSPQGSGQAVAVRVSADRCAFYNCRFLGWQDTLYLHSRKQYLKDCYVEGSVDFIFGNSTALLEHCHIHCKSPGYITAQSRKSPEESTGYVFLRCVITGNGESGYTYLGRPWRPFGRVVFAYSYMDACIRNAGWHNWGNEENENSACFYEYKCFGPGSCLSERVTWSRELMDEEAGHFLHYCFVDTDQDRPWLCPRTGGRTPCSA
ncbi:Pectinesterase 31 [Raphanus sativus]|uniref:Pectinesterase n=1 Tax=Raphanus sativus TaxID=3726 RepID=A0A6J0L5A4_RAPSA|nr:pectinesterase 31 [Raphanus sativus]KAJ4877827.1 Pectinesterase 31 [Raphanus sativus]